LLQCLVVVKLLFLVVGKWHRDNDDYEEEEHQWNERRVAYIIKE